MESVAQEARKRSLASLFARGYEIGDDIDFQDGRFVQLFRKALIGDLIREAAGGPKSDWYKVFSDPQNTLKGKAAYTGGRILADLINDGMRVPYWLLNHPLAQVSVAAQMASTAAGLAPNYRNLAEEMQKRRPGAPEVNRHMVDEEYARRMGFRYSQGEGPIASRGIPGALAGGVLPLLASTAMVATSGNHDLGNLLGGGRTPGYAAVLPQEGNQKQTSNAPLESLLRYVVGRTGRLLPWQEFTKERPEISPEDYANAKRHQFDKGIGDIGFFKATDRNLEGEPEFTMMGFRVPLSAAATAGGALVGGVGGAEIADRLIGKEMRRRKGIEDLDAIQMGTSDFSMVRRGNRRLVGSIIGALLGQAIGRGTTNVINDRYIQPRRNPEMIAAERAWLAGAVQRELDARRKEMVSPSLPPQEQPIILSQPL